MSNHLLYLFFLSFIFCQKYFGYTIKLSKSSGLDQVGCLVGSDLDLNCSQSLSTDITGKELQET